NSFANVDRRLSLFVEWMGGHKRYGRSGPHPRRGNRSPYADSSSSAAPIGESTRSRPNPTESGLKNPVSIVIRQPTPRLAANEDQSYKKGTNPPSHKLKGIPPKQTSICPPEIPIPYNWIPPPIRVKVSESGGVIVPARILL